MMLDRIYLLTIMNGGVDLIAKQEHQREQLNPHHESNQGPDGSIHLVVAREVGDVKGEAVGNQQASQGREDGSDGNELPVVVDGRTKIVDERNAKKKYNEDHRKPEEE